MATVVKFYAVSVVLFCWTFHVRRTNALNQGYKSEITQLLNLSGYEIKHSKNQLVTNQIAWW